MKKTSIALAVAMAFGATSSFADTTKNIDDEKIAERIMRLEKDIYGERADKADNNKDLSIQKVKRASKDGMQDRFSETEHRATQNASRIQTIEDKIEIAGETIGTVAIQTQANRERIDSNHKLVSETLGQVGKVASENRDFMNENRSEIADHRAKLKRNTDTIQAVASKTQANADKIEMIRKDSIDVRGITDKKIAKNGEHIKDLDDGLKKTNNDVAAVTEKAQANESDIKTNHTRLDIVEAANKARQAQSDTLRETIDTQASQLEDTRAELRTTQNTVADNTNRINKLEDKVNDNSYGIAMAMAMSALPPAYSVGEFNIAGGVGNYDGKSAVAVGMGYRMSENVNFKFSVSHGGNKTGASAGVAYSF